MRRQIGVSRHPRLPSSLVVVRQCSDGPNRTRPTGHERLQGVTALRSDDIVFASSEPQSEHLKGLVGHDQTHHERSESGRALDMEGRKQTNNEAARKRILNT